MVISDRQMGHPQLAAKSGALSCRLMHSCLAMDRHMQHAVFHTIAFLAFSCLAFSTPATWCRIFMSRNFMFRIFSVPSRRSRRRRCGSISPARTAISRKPAALCGCGRMTGQADGQMLDRFIDLAPHTMRAVS